ncbi:tyrosine-type recombinase/integrase [Thermoactinomyces sp. DSM 45892]|uniref:tyrosine-type recombinase/integrase n=1 Tax=Thermoactinomyces sp. DSM 45892 TaxID=1882753 RepID=UPI0008991357|nr:tyrosine-type recombinase/integrase [Thermoactinomyces sp. DSM 45892]SDX94842.1 Site-specific recombinase XerD [Thermoactinomyces sp. DSM 45892]
MSFQNNLLQLNGSTGSSIWECIKTFLERIEQNSIHTRTSYEVAIRDFFMTMCRKAVDDLVEGDLVFTKMQIESYQVQLRQRYKTATVNSRLSALKKCYKKLAEYGFDVKPSWFEVERYAEHDKVSYDPMTHLEIIEAIKLVGTTRKGFEKGLLIRVAYATAFRKDSILNLTWDSLIERDGVWFLRTLGKGNKWDYKKISSDLHDALMKQKELVGGEKIFRLTNKSVNRLISYLRDNMDFQDRKIAFHSFKKSSINEVAVITNYDLKAMQQQGNHASITTTLNDYMAKKSLDDLVIVDVNNHIPIERFDDLSHEQLLNLVKQADRSTQIKLLQSLDTLDL